MTDTASSSTSSESNLLNKIDTTQSREKLSKFRDYNDPEIVLQQFGEKLTEYGNEYLQHDELYEFNNKALSLNEFQNGKIMAKGIPEELATFAIDFMRNIQKEYNCQTMIEKAIAEQAASAFVRGLEIQKKLQIALDTQERLNNGHDACERNKYSPNGFFHACQRAAYGLQYVSFLGKELERANRQFLASIQTIKILKQAPMQVTIKAQTAVLGQNQIVQTNNSHE